MSHADNAASTFAAGFNCAQAVFSAFAAELGLADEPERARELALLVAGGFGGGIARQGEVCGAVTGAIMALGLKYGMAQAGDLETRDRGYALVRDFIQRFRDGHGAIRCCELAGYDISRPEERQKAQEAGVFKTLCPGLVRDAADLAEMLLQS